MFHYPARHLKTLPTISVGQADDLKIDAGDVRVWLSRCTEADGEPYNDKVTIERFVNGRWICVATYQG